MCLLGRDFLGKERTSAGDSEVLAPPAEQAIVPVSTISGSATMQVGMTHRSRTKLQVSPLETRPSSRRSIPITTASSAKRGWRFLVILGAERLGMRRWLHFWDKNLMQRLGMGSEWCIMLRITWGEH